MPRPRSCRARSSPTVIRLLAASTAVGCPGATEQPHRRLVATRRRGTRRGRPAPRRRRRAHAATKRVVALGAGRRVQRSGDEGDAAVTELEQVAGGGGGPAGVVDQHGVGRSRLRERAVDEHDRDPQRREALGGLGVVARRRQQQAVDPAAHRGQHVVLAGGALVGVAQHDRVAGVVGDRFGPLHDGGEEGVGDVGDDQPDGHRLAGLQPAGDVGGSEAELVHGGGDRLGPLHRRALEVPRHARRRDPGDPGDVGDRRTRSGSW